MFLDQSAVKLIERAGIVGWNDIVLDAKEMEDIVKIGKIKNLLKLACSSFIETGDLSVQSQRELKFLQKNISRENPKAISHNKEFVQELMKNSKYKEILHSLFREEQNPGEILL